MIVCHVCGTENPDGAKFCEGCGVELQAASPANADANTAPAVSDSTSTASGIPVSGMPAVATTPPLEPSSAPVEEPPLEAESEIAAPVVQSSEPVIAAPEVQAPPPVPVTNPEPDVKATMPDTMPTPVSPVAPPAGEKPKVARLIPRHAGAAPSETYTLSSPHMVVGRFDPSAGPVDIDLAGQQGEGYISRRHAELYQENGQWMVRDLGSTNGVYVKKAGQGQYSPRIIEPVALGDGDELAFGNVKFLFLYSSEA